MKQLRLLFPVGHVMGYLFSLILTAVALSVLLFNLPLSAGVAILTVSAVLQASLQLFLFMHIRETSTKGTLYLNIAYALFVGLVTIFGTLFAMIWGY